MVDFLAAVPTHLVKGSLCDKEKVNRVCDSLPEDSSVNVSYKELQGITCMFFIWGGSFQALIPPARYHCDDKVNVLSLEFQIVSNHEF